MRFIIPLNEPEENGSVTCHVIETNSDNRKTNREKLSEYFTAMGIPVTHHKRVRKAMGFVGKGLGR